jgi:aldehyde dehydrogenase
MGKRLPGTWRTVANAVLFQAVWFGAVLGGPVWALACLAGLALVTIQPETAARDALLVSILVVLGGLLDSAWAWLGVLDFGVPFAPAWILCMWAGVGLCVGHSLAFLELDANTVAYHLYEPLGVVGQIIPWNFPILMAIWKLAPALAAGNCVVLKPAEQTPASICVLLELVADLLPAGVLNVVQGFGVEAGKPLASSNRVAKVAFTGETTTGRLIMQYASENLIPVTLELGGKSPNLFFEDVLAKDDAFRQKSLEGFGMFALNQGEVCTCPSRALVQKSIWGQFMEMAVDRVREKSKPGNPYDTDTTVGAQASNDQLEKILRYIEIGKQEGAKVLLGGGRAELDGPLKNGYYVQPTVFSGQNSMRIFQEEIFGPVVSCTSFENYDEAIKIANDTLYGLGAAVWTRDTHTAFRAGRAIQAGRVWTNCYHLYPAHAAFGGSQQSRIGRETPTRSLNHSQQVKNLLVSYDPNPMGFF